MEIPTRDQVPVQDTWNLTRIYPDDAAWEADGSALAKDIAAIAHVADSLTADGTALYEGLSKIFALDRRLSKYYSYATLASDVDTSNQHYLGYAAKAQTLASDYQAQISFLESAILALSGEELAECYRQEPRLEDYRHFLDKIRTQSAHVLSAKEEAVFSQASDALASSTNTFNVLSNSDLEFPYVEDEDGQAIQLTDGSYSILIQSQKREVREDAFGALYSSYAQFENTFASTLAGVVKAHNFNAQVHRYPDARSAALAANNVPVEVYDQLVASVHDHLDLLHRYVALRKEILGLDDLQMWDMYVPITGKPSQTYSFVSAKKIAKTALAPMGQDYLKHVDYLFDNRCIDFVENRHKQSGAYSGGAYDTDAYELINWQDDLDSLYTLVHETGHSVHSMYTRETQPYVYGDYPIFLAEIASTTNENLLTNYLLDHTEDPKERAALLNYYLDSFKGTVYRQTQFAEFEQFIHESDQNGQPLTADFLNGNYGDLNQAYYGEAMTPGSDIDKEWARIPHFYYDFYVYQYATGFAAATALANKVSYGSDQDRANYLGFLKSGSSAFPLETMQKAGVDMTKADYLEDAFTTFARRLDEFTDLIKGLHK